jgi:uncharacterized protein YecT (DUF1311 family)
MRWCRERIRCRVLMARNATEAHTPSSQMHLRTAVKKSLLLFSLQATLMSAAYGASFNCENARSFSEKRICANTKLAELDETLSRTYQAVLRLSPAQEDSREQQRNWVRNFRDTCKDDACMARTYMNRQAELKYVLASLPFEPNRASPALVIPAEKDVPSHGEIVELTGRLEFGHDPAGGRIDFVNGKKWYTIRYAWQVSDQANEQIATLEETNEYVLVRGNLITLPDGTRRFDDRSKVEVFLSPRRAKPSFQKEN